MKSKILTKVITCVVCASVLVSVFAISSSAYTWVNPNAMNNDQYYFNLPRSSIVLKRNGLNADGITDLPYNLFISTAENVCRQTFANASLSYVLPSGYSSVFSLYTNVKQSNVYTTSFYLGGEFYYYSSNWDVDFVDLYYLDHINYGDVWISEQNIDNYSGTIYNSLQVSLDCTPLYVLDGQITDLPYVMAYYYVDYIDSNGSLNNFNLNIPVYLDTFDDGGSRFYATINYLPEQFSGGDVVYIQNVDIYLSADTEISIFYTRDDLIDNNKRAVSTFSNRMVPSSVFSEDVYDSMIDSIRDSTYDDGYSAGTSAGYNSGYDDGYIAGIAQGGSGTLNPFDSIISAVGSFLDWEFIDGISMAGLLSVVLGVCLVITFLKFFAGG